MTELKRPLAVLLDPTDAERDRELSRDHFGGYAFELLEHAGLDFEPLERRSLLGQLPPIVLLPYPLRLSPAEADSLTRHVESGGAVIACGGVEGGNELFGIEAKKRYLERATLSWPEGGLGLPAGEIPIWGAQSAATAAGSEALGFVRPGQRGASGERRSGQPGALLESDRAAGGEDHSGVALAIRRRGEGVSVYLAVDIARSVVTMQQGVPVFGDAESAPDGSAKLEDGIRKSDDGAVIGWEWREESPEGPVFLTPYADRLRDLLVATIAECADRTATPLAIKWYWPNALPAVATLSFDTDSNEDADGWAFLETLEALQVEGSWCVMYPGGYSTGLYDAIRERGDEIALHYDALTSDLKGVPHCGWSWEDFSHQLEWLKQETGVSLVISQKNHVTRWEGWLELFRWVERSGLLVDQTKGPSKIGNLGFNFGSCHLWRPMEDSLNGNRLMNVFELPFLTHDMFTSQRRVDLRRVLVDVASGYGGAAHFIFHPQRIHEEGMREALADLVSYARERGLEWWTSQRIVEWEGDRRKASVHLRTQGTGLRLETNNAPTGLTVLLFGVGDRFTGERADRVQAFGHQALRLVLADQSITLRDPSA